MLKKASMGIGTLIIFISAILAAAVGAGVIILTQNRLQGESLRIGAEAREQITTTILMESVRGVNIKNNEINKLNLRIKLGPASSPINLNKTGISIITPESSSFLLYGGPGNEKYFTNRKSRLIEETINDSFTRLRTDLDSDNKEDYIMIKDSTTLLFNLSSKGFVEVEIPDISSPGTEIDFITEIGNTNSYIQIIGTIVTSNTFCESIDVIISPFQIETGLFTVEKLIKSDRDIEHVLRQGDVIRVYLETATPLKEENSLSLSFYNEVGTIYSRDVVIPSVLTGTSANIFP